MAALREQIQKVLDWLTLRVDATDELDAIRARILAGLACLTALTASLAIVGDLIAGRTSSLALGVLLLLTVLGALLALRVGWFEFARHGFVIGVFGFANLIAFLGGGIDSIAVVPLLFVLVLSPAVLQTPSALVVAGAVLSTGLLHHTQVSPERQILLPPAPVFAMAAVMFSVVMLGLVRLARTALADLSSQRATLRSTIDDLNRTSVSRDRIAGILAALDAFVVVTDSENRILQLNPAVERRGWSTSDLLNRPLQELLPGLDPDNPSTWRNASFLTPSKDALPVAITQGDFGEGGQRVWAATDVSAERAAMSALSQANQRAHAASTAKSNFLANMSHELRTPLNAIIGYTELLSDELSDPEHLQDLDRVSSAARSLLGLINGVLDLSKIEAGKEDLELATVRIGQLLENPLALVEPRAEAKGLDLVVTGDFDPTIELHTDRIKLEQVLTNLLTNAIKFTPEGRVSLRVEMWRRETLPWLRLCVEDTGIGLTGEQLETIFEPFVQAENDLGHQGTGLGLSICKAYVEMLGGQLYAESTVGAGSRFVVELPVATMAHATPTRRWTETPLPEARADVQRVLVIDDDVAFLTLMERVLHATNRQVITTTEPRQALDWARTYRADLIILDVAMPSISGWSFLVRLRETASNDSPVLVVSGAGEQEVASALGAAGFLQKPVTNHELSSWVERLLSN